jgi:hypothetical protein
LISLTHSLSLLSPTHFVDNWEYKCLLFPLLHTATLKHGKFKMRPYTKPSPELLMNPLKLKSKQLSYSAALPALMAGEKGICMIVGEGRQAGALGLLN